MFDVTFNAFFLILAIAFVVMAMAGFVRQFNDKAGDVSYYTMWVGFFGCVALVMMIVVSIVFSII